MRAKITARRRKTSGGELAAGGGNGSGGGGDGEEETSEAPRVLILGPPGAGKTTLAVAMAANFGSVLVSVDAEAKAAADAGSEQGAPAPGWALATWKWDESIFGARYSDICWCVTGFGGGHQLRLAVGSGALFFRIDIVPRFTLSQWDYSSAADGAVLHRPLPTPAESNIQAPDSLTKQQEREPKSAVNIFLNTPCQQDRRQDDV